MSLQLKIEGVAVWSPALPGWKASHAVLCGNAAPGAGTMERPAPALLAANERRRAPDSVLLALEVAQQACAMAGREAHTLPAIFASAYGDLAINDYLCATLATSPRDLSPTKFHNSVHNAPAGYWAIATGCMASTGAISAGAYSFGAGLLEAALLVQTESTPVVYAAYDVPASGPLADVIPSRTAFGAAFVLSPPGGPGRGAGLRIDQRPDDPRGLASEASLLQSLHRDNPAAACLPLLIALARGAPQALALPAGPHIELHLEISPWQN